MKFIGSGATATQPQLAIAEFIRGGHYLQHLRRMRARYQQNRDRMTDLILKYFPAGTRVSHARRLYAVDRTGLGVRHPAAEPPS